MVPALPADGTGYKATLGLLAAEFAALDIPVRVLQYDSWWYYKSNDQGTLRSLMELHWLNEGCLSTCQCQTIIRGLVARLIRNRQLRNCPLEVTVAAIMEMSRTVARVGLPNHSRS